MVGSPEAFDILRELEASGRLGVRLVVPLWIKPEHGPEVLAEYTALASERGDLWRGGVAKFFIDGVVEPAPRGWRNQTLRGTVDGRTGPSLSATRRPWSGSPVPASNA